MNDTDNNIENQKHLNEIIFEMKESLDLLRNWDKENYNRLMDDQRWTTIAVLCSSHLLILNGNYKKIMKNKSKLVPEQCFHAENKQKGITLFNVVQCCVILCNV